MPLELNTRQADYKKILEEFLTIRAADTSDVAPAVQDIIQQVQENGDAALLSYTKQLDQFDATAESIKVRPEEIADALNLISSEVLAALKLAAGRIESYSKKQMPDDLDYTDETGLRLGHRWTAIDNVGLYVPGGQAAYPSSVLMNAIPAKVAGAKRMVMVVPAPEGKINPAVLAAAHVAGISEIYKVGGAQAVAALAYGTETIAPVDKIVGPGNAYVAEAKRQVFGRVGIDMIAGPSEILVLADSSCNPRWVAADLLSQAEHDALAQAILITDDEAVAKSVAAEMAALLKDLPRGDIVAKSWADYGAIITVENWEQGCDLANKIAAEHVELAVQNPEELLQHIRHAGAIFLGHYTPEAVGDYMAGPSHVLPTCGSARFSSGLSVFDFLKRTSLIDCSAEALAQIGRQTALLADTEGLGAHALSVRIRDEQ